MHASPLVLGAISFLAILGSAANSKLARSSNEDGIFAPDTSPLPDQSASPDDQTSPANLLGIALNLESSSTDGASGSLFENPDNSNELFSSVNDLADCSAAPAVFPTIGKSRVKRVDGSPKACTNPTTATDQAPQDPTADDILANPGFQREFKQLLELAGQGLEEEHERNSVCFVATEGTFPWGVCSSGDPDDVSPMSWTWVNMDLWVLFHATIGTSDRTRAS